MSQRGAADRDWSKPEFSQDRRGPYSGSRPLASPIESPTPKRRILTLPPERASASRSDVAGEARQSLQSALNGEAAASHRLALRSAALRAAAGLNFRAFSRGSRPIRLTWTRCWMKSGDTPFEEKGKTVQGNMRRKYLVFSATAFC